MGERERDREREREGGREEGREGGREGRREGGRGRCVCAIVRVLCDSSVQVCLDVRPARAFFLAFAPRPLFYRHRANAASRTPQSVRPLLFSYTQELALINKMLKAWPSWPWLYQ